MLQTLQQARIVQPMPGAVPVRKGNKMNIAYVNNTSMDIRPFHQEVMASLKDTCSLPEEIADFFELSVVANPDGSPRYILNAA